MGATNGDPNCSYATVALCIDQPVQGAVVNHVFTLTGRAYPAGSEISLLFSGYDRNGNVMEMTADLSTSQTDGAFSYNVDLQPHDEWTGHALFGPVQIFMSFGPSAFLHCPNPPTLLRTIEVGPGP